MRKPVLAICEQQRCRSAQSDQHLSRSLPRWYNISSFYIRNFKPLASLYSWEGRFESTLVGNPEDRFSRDKAQINISFMRALYEAVFVCLLFFFRKRAKPLARAFAWACAWTKQLCMSLWRIYESLMVVSCGLKIPNCLASRGLPSWGPLSGVPVPLFPWNNSLCYPVPSNQNLDFLCSLFLKIAFVLIPHILRPFFPSSLEINALVPQNPRVTEFSICTEDP